MDYHHSVDAEIQTIPPRSSIYLMPLPEWNVHGKDRILGHPEALKEWEISVGEEKCTVSRSNYTYVLIVILAGHKTHSEIVDFENQRQFVVKLEPALPSEATEIKQ
jgi:hypothetical protein